MKYVYKSVNALIALAVLPTLYFFPIIQFRVKSSVLQFIKAGTPYMGDALSFNDISAFRTKLETLSGGESSGTMMTAFKSLLTPALVCAVFLAIVVLTAITCAVLAFVSKKKYPACAAAIFGIVFTNMFVSSFNSMIAPLADGTMNLANMTGTWWMSFVAEIDFIAIGNAHKFVYALFAFILIWNVIFQITEEKPGKLKKAS